ncbi:hypothetical protein M413DRAFT_27550 [Hebeloma cylindrosporum]|uniref:C2H2-type domain-containing protein n=1 Tax=Hebeloma cylindrosporum TaxID=76867 RepID=A0A0C2YLY3_HEBCY|nr:hypothetical protein M413DRAFT_27550 [Hebeloma cylindrosporum h7]
MPPRSSKSRGYVLAPARWDERRRDSPDESDVDTGPPPLPPMRMKETVKQTPFRVIKEPELRPIPSPPWKSRPLKRPGEFNEEERRNVRTVAPHHPTYDIQHLRNGSNGEFCSSAKTREFHGEEERNGRTISPHRTQSSRNGELFPSGTTMPPLTSDFAEQGRMRRVSPHHPNSRNGEFCSSGTSRPPHPGEFDEERRNLRTIGPHYDSRNGEFCSSTKLPPMRSLSPPPQHHSRPLLAPPSAYSTPYYPPPPTEAYLFRHYSRTPENSNRNLSDDDMNGGPRAQRYEHRRPASPSQRNRYPLHSSPPLLPSIPSQHRRIPSQSHSRPPSPPPSALHRRVPSNPHPPSPLPQHRRVLSPPRSEPPSPSPLPPPPSASSSSGSSHRRGPRPAPPGPNHGFHSLTRRDFPSALEVRDSQPGEWYEREKRERERNEYEGRLRRDEYYEQQRRQHEPGRYPRSPPRPPLQEYVRYLHGPTPPPTFNPHAYAPQHSPQQRPMNPHLPPLQNGPPSPHPQRQPPYQYTSYPPPLPPHIPSHTARPSKRNPPKRAPKPRPKRTSQPLPKHQRLLQTPTPSPPPGARRPVPPVAPHVWVAMGANEPGGGYEVHLHGKGKKERAAAKGGGVDSNGNAQFQHLNEGRVYGDGAGAGVANGDREELRNGNAVHPVSNDPSREGQLRKTSSNPTAPPPVGQSAFSLSTGPQEHLMMIPMNHVGGAQFVLKPPKAPRARGKLRGRSRVDAEMVESTSQTAAVENVVTNPVVEEPEATTTTTVLNGGEDVVRDDERDASDSSASEDGDDDESVDSSLHPHYSVHPNTSAQNSEAQSLLPPSSTQADPGGSETNTFAAPPRPSRKVKRYPCDVCGQIFTRSGDVRRHKESRHSEGSSGCRCPFCGRVLTRQDALQRHWDKYCRKRSKRHLERQSSAVGSSGPSGMGALIGGVNGMVMTRVAGNGRGVMQEVGGVMNVFSHDAFFREIVGGRRRGASISSAEGNSVPGGSVRNGSESRSVSRSWSRSRSPSRSRSRSRSPSVEIIENPDARPHPSNRSPSAAGTNGSDNLSAEQLERFRRSE